MKMSVLPMAPNIVLISFAPLSHPAVGFEITSGIPVSTFALRTDDFAHVLGHKELGARKVAAFPIASEGYCIKA